MAGGETRQAPHTGESGVLVHHRSANRLELRFWCWLTSLFEQVQGLACLN